MTTLVLRADRRILIVVDSHMGTERMRSSMGNGLEILARYFALTWDDTVSLIISTSLTTWATHLICYDDRPTISTKSENFSIAATNSFIGHDTNSERNVQSLGLGGDYSSPSMRRPKRSKWKRMPYFLYEIWIDVGRISMSPCHQNDFERLLRWTASANAVVCTTFVYVQWFVN